MDTRYYYNYRTQSTNDSAVPIVQSVRVLDSIHRSDWLCVCKQNWTKGTNVNGQAIGHEIQSRVCIVVYTITHDKSLYLVAKRWYRLYFSFLNVQSHYRWHPNKFSFRWEHIALDYNFRCNVDIRLANTAVGKVRNIDVTEIQDDLLRGK